MSRTEHTILYLHGMGGGSDSRIPSILREFFSTSRPEVRVICHTYDFDPEIAHVQITSWLEQYRPNLVIGESLGSLHALRVYDIPLLFVSPALNTPFFFRLLYGIIWIPGMKRLFARIYRPREGDRQPLKFTREVLKKYEYHGKAALVRRGGEVDVHAFFGTRDHYRRSGVVSIKAWEKRFGNTYTVYQGTHFMENEYVYTLLIPRVLNLLDNKK